MVALMGWPMLELTWIGPNPMDAATLLHPNPTANATAWRKRAGVCFLFILCSFGRMGTTAVS